MQSAGGSSVESDPLVRAWTERALPLGSPLTAAQRAGVVDGIRECYRAAGLSCPDRVVWVSSPGAGEAVARFVQDRVPSAGEFNGRLSLETRWRLLNAAHAAIHGAIFSIAFGLLALVVPVMVWWGRRHPSPDDGAGDLPAPSWTAWGNWLGGVTGVLIIWVIMLAVAVVIHRGSPVFAGAWSHRKKWAKSVAEASYYFLLCLPPIGLFLIPVLVIAADVFGWLGGELEDSVIDPDRRYWWLLAVVVSGMVVTGGIGAAVVGMRWPLPLPPLIDPVSAKISERLDTVLDEIGGPALAKQRTRFFSWAASLAQQVRGDTGRGDATWPPPYSDVDRALRQLAVATAGPPTESPTAEFTLAEPFVGRFSRRAAVLAWYTGRHPRGLSPAGARMAAGYVAACGAGWWWPHSSFVVISEPPAELSVERVGDSDGGYRLHRLDGPAVRWSDGFTLYFSHGTEIPRDLAEGDWSIDQIHRQPNTEVRRAAIERIGWAEYIDRAGWRQVAAVPDPGNPPHELVLYEDAQRRLGDVRVLVMTNGSPDRSGEPRRHAETVPETIDDPVAAAAWQYGCDVETYRRLQRRT